mmetsp:Transcript_5917/g.8690  ORF Transcript_5917/g.8690 Transcript_5917/m.8690 type:complete len:100 (+) Transcript_5917:345-644(+)
MNSVGSPYRVGVARAVSHYSPGRSHDMQNSSVQMLLAFIDIYQGLLRQASRYTSVWDVQGIGTAWSIIHSAIALGKLWKSYCCICTPTNLPDQKNMGPY